jgi:hypothetical protein
VNSTDTPASGSRWEPPPVPTAQAPLADPPPAAARPASPLMKSRLALVAAAVGLVAVGGIGGFVLGQSSSATAGTTSDFGGPAFGGRGTGTGTGTGAPTT